MSHSLSPKSTGIALISFVVTNRILRPRVAFILGSGLGALADQIEDAVAISYEKLRGSR